MAATEIRCSWCRSLIIEALDARSWTYTCSRCKGRESSTGVVRAPELRHLPPASRRVLKNQ